MPDVPGVPLVLDVEPVPVLVPEAPLAPDVPMAVEAVLMLAPLVLLPEAVEELAVPTELAVDDELVELDPLAVEAARPPVFPQAQQSAAPAAANERLETWKTSCRPERSRGTPLVPAESERKFSSGIEMCVGGPSASLGATSSVRGLEMRSGRRMKEAS